MFFFFGRKWGVPEKINELNISWYMPGVKEINCVQDLLNKFLLPELETLTKYANGEISFSREYLRRSLRIVVSVLAAQIVFPMWDEPPLQLLVVLFVLPFIIN